MDCVNGRESRGKRRVGAGLARGMTPCQGGRKLSISTLRKLSIPTLRTPGAGGCERQRAKGAWGAERGFWGAGGRGWRGVGGLSHPQTPRTSGPMGLTGTPLDRGAVARVWGRGGVGGDSGLRRRKEGCLGGLRRGCSGLGIRLRRRVWVRRGFLRLCGLRFGWLGGVLRRAGGRRCLGLGRLRVLGRGSVLGPGRS